MPIATKTARDTRAALAIKSFNVQTYGAKGDGVADDYAAVQAAIDAAQAAGGGKVKLPRGNYRFSAGVTVNSNNITIEGDGPEATVLVTTFASGPLITFGDGVTLRYRNFIREVGFNTTVTRTSGAYVKFNYVSQGGVRDFWMNVPYKGVELLSTVLVHVEKGSMINPVATNGVGVLIDGGNDHNLRDVMIAGNVSAQCRAAVEIYATGATFLENVGGIWCGNPLILQPNSAGKVIEHVFSSRCAWDTSTGHGMLIQALAGTTIRRCKFVQDWTASNGGNGVVLAGAGTVQDMEFIGLRAYNNGQYGAYVEAGTNIRFVGGTYAGNSQSSSNTYSGLAFANVSGFSVIGVTSGQVAGLANTQKHGILVSGTADNFVLEGNDARANATSNMALSVSLSASKIVRDNLGYVTENRGVGSFTSDASGDITITHGLSGTPSRVFVAINNAPAVVITSPIASSFGSTTAKVRCFNGASGGAPITNFTMSSVSWWAEM